MAIMGRDSAYSGKGITWPDLPASTAGLGPAECSDSSGRTAISATRMGSQEYEGTVE